MRCCSRKALGWVACSSSRSSSPPPCPRTLAYCIAFHRRLVKKSRERKRGPSVLREQRKEPQPGGERFLKQQKDKEMALQASPLLPGCLVYYPMSVCVFWPIPPACSLACFFNVSSKLQPNLHHFLCPPCLLSVSRFTTTCKSHCGIHLVSRLAS